MNPTLDTAAALTPANAGLRAGLKVSLWDMLERYAFGFYDIIRHLETLRAQTYLQPNKMAVVESTDSTILKTCLASLRTECLALAFVQTADQIDYVTSRMQRIGDLYTYGHLLEHCDNLLTTFGSELKKQNFLRIPQDKDAWFDRPALFGPEVESAFSSARDDIRNAGNAFSVELWNACVFHAMRALEPALESLAAEVKVSYAMKNWSNVTDQVIRALDGDIGNRLPQEKREFLREAATQFHFITDAWRNKVSHKRTTHNEGTALSILTSVRDFMRALQKGLLSEFRELIARFSPMGCLAASSAGRS